MRIGIDIDDTLVNTSNSFRRVLKKYNINFSKRYSGFSTIWTKEEREYIFNNFLYEILMGAKFKKNAKKVIKELSKSHDLFIITARSNHYFDSIKDETTALIKNNGLNIKEIYFEQDEKAQLAKKLKLDLMIDDSKSVYNNMKKENIDCILFGDEIKNWNDVLKYIERKER